jgi:hypothetical protein
MGAMVANALGEVVGAVCVQKLMATPRVTPTGFSQHGDFLVTKKPAGEIEFFSCIF